MNDQEILNVMTLTLLPKLGSSNAKILYETFGSATELFNNIEYIKDYLPNASELLIKTLSSHNDYLPRAEKELKFADEKRIRCLSIGDSDYPQRLKDCSDAPLLIYYKGNASLTPPKSISIVGTRHCTEYGKELCRRFVSDLREAVPDVQIISGLAYGIDIEAHRNALDSGIDTIGVLAHGLDQIYPSSHRSTAIKMLGQGGLV
ncbi:MAG: DNA-processing protein DprA, partial [Bacteroidaceae bacterium]|nr:DNA-processing protein DprA [Bacteroidaceae bacterium]